MTSQLIESGLSNRPYSLVGAKEECCKSHDLFSCQVMDCSATRIPSSSVTGHHPQPTGSLVGVGWVYPSAEVQLVYSTAPADRASGSGSDDRSDLTFPRAINNKNFNDI